MDDSQEYLKWRIQKFLIWTAAYLGCLAFWGWFILAVSIKG